MLLPFSTFRVSAPPQGSESNIHIANYLQEFYKNDPASKQQLVEEVRNCCLHNGFFQITGHKVPIELQNKIMDWNKKFFDLPLEQKNTINKGMQSSPPQARDIANPHLQTQQTPGTAGTS